MKKEIGHTFLSRLGKKRLRPGGKTATYWLLEQVMIDRHTKVLEVACNQCTTAIELAKRYGCQIVAVDQDKSALEKGKQAIEKEQVAHLITLQQANALKLPFEDNGFDIVINEAMLTMLNQAAKQRALKEYLRILKPGGVLLTHDVAYLNDNAIKVGEELRQIINVNVEPLTIQQWQECFEAVGLQKINVKYGNMTLMSPVGMIKDEGVLGASKIIRNGLRRENREQFKSMRQFFKKESKSLCYIAMAYKKRKD